MTETAVADNKSTIVRTRDLQRSAMRTAFGVLERVAPWLASRWALDIWCTLPGNAGRRRDERPEPGVITSVLVDGCAVAVEAWGDGPPVYLVHGWGGWRGQLGRFVQPLVDAGRRVIAFDAPGHGDSAPGSMGKGRGNGMEFARSLAELAKIFGEPTAVIGHSFGCATTSVAMRDGLAIGRMAFIAPGVDPMTYVDGIAQVVGFGPRTVAGLISRIETVARRPLSDFNPTTMGLNEQTLPPTLIIHDRRDKEVPYDEGARLAETWPSAELITTDGLGHQRILRDSDVVSRVTDFVTG